MDVLASMTMPTRSGKIDLLAERGDFFRGLLVVEKSEVVLLQVGDVVAVLIGDREDEIDFVDAEMEDLSNVV